MSGAPRPYLPAAGRDWLLPLYDPLVRLAGVDNVRRALLEQANMATARRVLDIGCGTGTLATEIKRLHPGIAVVGIDPDPKALARSRRKAARAGLSLQFDQGYADELPYADASFDRVFSSLMFHHVPVESRARTLREARRVIAGGGSLHLLDFASVHADGHDASGGHHRVSEREAGSAAARMIAAMQTAGFDEAVRTDERTILFGHLRIACYRAEVRK